MMKQHHRRPSKFCSLMILALSPLVVPPLLMSRDSSLFPTEAEISYNHNNKNDYNNMHNVYNMTATPSTTKLPSLFRPPVIDRFGYRLKNISNPGHVFFKHLRKAGGTSVLHYLAQATRYRFQNQTADTAAAKNSNWTSTKTTTKPLLKWFLYHQEFGTLHWDCPRIDRERWESTFSVIVLRDPIDRVLSEFFYSGPGKDDTTLQKLLSKIQQSSSSKSKSLFNTNSSSIINGDGNVANKTNRSKRNDHDHNEKEDRFVQKLVELLLEWTKRGLKETPGRNFAPNYQTKMLSGETNNTPNPINYGRYEHCNSCCDRRSMYKPSASSFKNKKKYIAANYKLYEQLKDCFKIQNPCAYGSGKGKNNRRNVWQGGIQPTIGNDTTDISLEHAKTALMAFDLVLLTETMSQQVHMVSDMLNVPLEAVSLGRHRMTASTTTGSNSGKNGSVNYKDLLMKKAPNFYKSLVKYNIYDIALYDHALTLNIALVEQWKQEKEGGRIITRGLEEETI